MKVQVSRKDIISLFYKKCDLYQNIINEIFIELKSQFFLYKPKDVGY